MPPPIRSTYHRPPVFFFSSFTGSVRIKDVSKTISHTRDHSQYGDTDGNLARITKTTCVTTDQQCVVNTHVSVATVCSSVRSDQVQTACGRVAVGPCQCWQRAHRGCQQWVLLAAVTLVRPRPQPLPMDTSSIPGSAMHSDR